MSNWKKYGGINNLENNNNVSVYSFVADIFTLRQSYYGTFDICGELHVSGNAIIDSNLKANNTTVVNDLSTNRLFVNDISTMFGNVFMLSNLDISGNINLRQQLFLGNSNNAYLFGTDLIGNIGINTKTPIAALDVSSSRPLAFNVGSTVQENIYAVPLQNSNHRGIVMNVNTGSSQIDFYNDASINYQSINPDGRIQYMYGGNLIIDVSDNTSILSKLSVSNRATYSHVMGETAVIYDISAGPYLKLVYENSSETTGNGASIIANDSSSNTFMNIVTPSGQGLSIGGGVYPNDQKRSMGSVGWRDPSLNYIPSINIVSGNSNVRNRSTIGINTYGPITETYGVDINGAIHVKNGDLTITNQANFEIMSLTICKTLKNCAIALGSPFTSINNTIYKQKILYTSNYGETWNENYDLSGGFIEEYPNVYIRTSYIYDLSLSIIAGDYGFAFYSYNGFYSNWKGIRVSCVPDLDKNLYKIKTVYINPTKRVFFGIDISGSTSIIYWFDLPSDIYTDSDGIVSNTVRDGTYYLYFAGINSMDGCGNSIWVVGNKYIVNYSGIDTSSPSTTTYTNTFNYTYNSIFVYDPINIIAAGSNTISYSVNGGTNWTDFSLNGIVNSIGLFDMSNAIAVCNSGKIFTSSNWQTGSSSWTQISTEALNVSGNANRLNDASYNLTNVGIINNKNFYITKIVSKYAINSVLGNTSLFHVYLPNLFNNITNYVFDVSGSSRISGDMNVNEGGKIASNNQTFYLLNNGVKQIYFGGDASYIYAGSFKNSTFVTKYDLNVLHDASINGNLVVGGNALVDQKLGVLMDTSLNANLFVAWDSSLNGNLVVGGNALVDRKLGVLQDTSLNANLFVAWDSSFNGNLVVGGNALVDRKLGVLQDTSLNANLFVAWDSSFNGNLTVGGNARIERKLGVIQDTSLNANLFVAWDSSFNGNLTVGGNTRIERKLGVIQDTSLNANLFVAWDSSFNGNLTVNRKLGILQDTSLNANLFVAWDSSFNGNLTVGGNASVNKKLGVLKDTSLNANLFVAWDSSFNGNFTVGGNAIVNSKLGVLQDTSLNANLFVARDSSFNGNLVVNRKLGVLQDTSLNANLFVAWDSSLNGNLTVSGNLVLNRKLGVLQDTSLNANLFVAWDSSLNGNLVVGGNTTVNRKLGVLQDTSLNANLFVAWDSSFNGNLTVGGNTSVNKKLSVLQDTSLNANLFVTWDSSLNGNLVVGGNTIVNRKLGVLQDTSLNANLFVLRDSSFNGNLVIGNNLVINKNISVNLDLSANGNIYGNQIIRTNLIESLGGITTGGPGSIGSGPYDINIGSFNFSGVSARNIKVGNFNNSITTRNNLYLGGPQDQIIVQGEVILSQNIKAGPLIYLNYLAGPNSSAGSGIRIGDDGVLDNGYIAVSSDRKGYVLKATEPIKRNTVKFDVFNMTLANTQPSGLISITPSPAGYDSSFTLASSPIDPSNIILGNKTLSSATQQVIDISLSVMGLMSIGTMVLNPNYALTVSGSIYQPGGLVWQF